MAEGEPCKAARAGVSLVPNLREKSVKRCQEMGRIVESPVREQGMFKELLFAGGSVEDEKWRG